jgi:hypothetical protein
MIKPDWKNAPEWAQWLAQDYDHIWFWFEHEPKPSEDGLWLAQSGKCQRAMITDQTAWLETKERRPEKLFAKS